MLISGNLCPACVQDKSYANNLLKSNQTVAYNYLGLAIRLSYSIGIHVFDSGTSDKTIATAACWPGQFMFARSY